MNKTQPDRGYIDGLMETTFSLRRLEVTETDVLKTMSEWKVQWPELCFAAQLRKEMLRLNLTDFQAMLKSFAATVENTFVPLALECRRRRLVQATVSAAAVNGISLNSDIVSLNLPPQDVMTQENMLQELPHLLKDKHPFLVKSGEEPSEYPLNEGHIKKEGDKFSIWVDQVKMVKDITSLNESCWLLSAVYYTYNLKYSQHFKHSLIFLQRVCGVAKSPLSRKVDNLLAQLQVSRN